MVEAGGEQNDPRAVAVDGSEGARVQAGGEEREYVTRVVDHAPV